MMPNPIALFAGAERLAERPTACERDATRARLVYTLYPELRLARAHQLGTTLRQTSARLLHALLGLTLLLLFKRERPAYHLPPGLIPKR